MALEDVHEKISVKTLAAILGIGDRWCQQLESQGYIVKASYGKYDLAASVQGYIRFVKESEVEKAGEQLTPEKANFDFERARKLKLENDQREALLIKTPDAIAAIDHIFGEVRTGLAGVAARLTGDVAERRRIDDAIDSALADITSKLDQAGSALRAGRDPAEANGETVAGPVGEPE